MSIWQKTVHTQSAKWWITARTDVRIHLLKALCDLGEWFAVAPFELDPHFFRIQVASERMRIELDKLLFWFNATELTDQDNRDYFVCRINGLEVTRRRTNNGLHPWHYGIATVSAKKDAFAVRAMFDVRELPCYAESLRYPPEMSHALQIAEAIWAGELGMDSPFLVIL